MRASTTDTDDDVHGGGHRRAKRSSASLPVRRSPAWHHRWVLLNRTGARLDGFRGDRTTSAMSRTSRGDEISVWFELTEPPGISVLAFDWQPWPSTASLSLSKSTGKLIVIAAHRDVVLLAMTMTSYENTYPSNTVIDLFVYQASSDPSLLLLPSPGMIYSHLLGDGAIGIMSCTSNNDVDDTPSFVVAGLQIWRGKGNNIRQFRSGTGHWESFEKLHVHGASGDRDVRWWSTDAAMPYGRRYMIWVDYYSGMILMDMYSQLLRYVPLPVDRVGNPNDIEFGRGCPKHSSRVCVTRHGIKYVSVDSQHLSNFGVGHRNVLNWNNTFRITTWSLREDDDDHFRWKKDMTMHEEEFWDAFDGGDRPFGFPHVQPNFPVVDPDNPDIVVLRLEKPCFSDPDELKWLIEVDLRKKVLLAATVYSKKESDGLSGAETINSARRESDWDPILSELPRYLNGGQACKKRRQ